ncbi:putative ING family protein [Lupinus albus]|uniref:Putative ING family protein n=1 Tax=Lupinus albus TaxID=3870 RepID=A0A6A4PI35_LUPAL|nr:putative ING family protein [Lupinus albus]
MATISTSNSCTIRFTRVVHKAFVPPSPWRTHGKRILRNLTIYASQSISAADPIIIEPPTSPHSLSNAPQLSDEWFALRKDKLTTSTFSTALGFWKGSRRFELWHQKVFATKVQNQEASKKTAMEWGVINEATAIDQYKKITGNEVTSMAFAVHSNEHFDWLGASPDGLLGSFPGGGILEVKCPFNKGKPETGSPWLTMPFYYMPQVQGQMEIVDCEWVDLYCWTPSGSTIFRVLRDRNYWNLIHGILKEFWWENVVPAREALRLGCKEKVKSYKPASRHKQTGLAIAQSLKLASQIGLINGIATLMLRNHQRKTRKRRKGLL